MKVSAMGMDLNGRSVLTEIEVPLRQLSDTEFVTEKQQAKGWTLASSVPSEPVDGGPHEMHLTNAPYMVCIMGGHAEITLQDGDVCRLGAGEPIFLDGRALHHTTFARSREPVLRLNLSLHGTENFAFK
jgi:hypothetical protein